MNPLDTLMHEGKSIVVFGELLYDRIHRMNLEQIEELPGGAPANFAYRFQSRQSATESKQVCLVSAVGSDTRDSDICVHLNQCGLDTNYIQSCATYPTGTVDVTRTENDVSYVINVNSAYDNIVLTEDLLAIAQDAKVFYFGTLIQRNPLGSLLTLQSMLEVVSPYAVKFVDMNLRKGCYTPDSLRWSAENASVLKLNDQEWTEVAQALGIQAVSARDFAQKFVAQKEAVVIVTLAERGAFSVSQNEERVQFDYEPGYNLEANIVDTIGCGDSFCAEFARLFALGKPVKECLINANKIGAATALTLGGQSLIIPEHLAKIERCPRVIDREIEHGIQL